MKQINGEKSVVAWFKLADLIERGEKERALGVLRLLTHSFEDLALARQLEADVLRTFNDELAFERYKDAIALYQNSARPQQALMLFEMMYESTQLSCLELLEMITLSNKLALSVKLIALYTHLFTLDQAWSYRAQIVLLADESINLLTNEEQSTLKTLLATNKDTLY